MKRVGLQQRCVCRLVCAYRVCACVCVCVRVCVCVCVRVLAPVHTQEGYTGLQQECETCREQQRPTASCQVGEERKRSFSWWLWEGVSKARGPKHLPALILGPAGSPSSSGIKRVPLAWAGCHTWGQSPVELSARVHNIPGRVNKVRKGRQCFPSPWLDAVRQRWRHPSRQGQNEHEAHLGSEVVGGAQHAPRLRQNGPGPRPHPHPPPGQAPARTPSSQIHPRQPHSPCRRRPGQAMGRAPSCPCGNQWCVQAGEEREQDSAHSVLCLLGGLGAGRGIRGTGTDRGSGETALSR